MVPPTKPNVVFILADNIGCGRGTDVREMEEHQGHLRYAESFETPIEKPYWPRVYDLTSDPHEDYNLMVYKLDMLWILSPAGQVVADYQKSVAEYPNIKPGEDFTGYK